VKNSYPGGENSCQMAITKILGGKKLPRGNNSYPGGKQLPRGSNSYPGRKNSFPGGTTAILGGKTASQGE
jgi:hypothetical protein